MIKQQEMYYGGDYNPEQWDRETIINDMELMKQAGVNYVSINIFGWKNIQPSESEFNFEFLDWMMNLLHENGIYIDLANATASPPAWLVNKYPEMMPIDENSNRLVHGSRQHYCPTSPIYRGYAQKLTEKVAQRYANHPGLVMWHINNEYTCHIQACYCDNCNTTFQQWLEKKYGTIKALNKAWSTTFWSQAYNSWQEIFLPQKMPTFKNPSQQLDYKRFISDMNLEIYLLEKAAILKHSKNIPVMNNLMGLHKHVDGFKFAKEMDVVSWNTYPNPKEQLPAGQFLANDLTRSLKKQPFLIMEQATSAVNWRAINKRKLPGQMRLWNFENVAHGADGLMFFQWRQSVGGSEKYHSAMVPHSGRADSKVFKEVAQIGNELKKLKEIVGSTVKAEVAIVFDWESWWALEIDAKPSAEVKYIKQMISVYEALRAINVTVDFVHPSEDFSAYKLVIVQNLYMIEQSHAASFESYVQASGTLLVNFFSGIVNETDAVYPGGYPGAFKRVLGIEVEEFSPLYPYENGSIQYNDERLSTKLWEEVVLLEGAESIATYNSYGLAGCPAITKHSFGEGTSYYLSTQLDKAGLQKFLTTVLAQANVSLEDERIQYTNNDVAITYRETEIKLYAFVLNYAQGPISIQVTEPGYSMLDEQEIQGEVEIAVFDLEIIRFDK